jgi:HPt (histidine-containing phosphotransfer) domain-containing protein
MSNILNMDIINGVMQIDEDDATFYFSMVQVVFDEAEEMFTGIEDGVNNADYTGLRNVTHKFKGRASTLGLEALAEQLGIMENLSRDKGDMAEIINIAEKIPELLEQTRLELENLKKGV